ncbi:MAG: 1-acyl-sn-glycerol-3-phosphate acyltransferase [Rhodothermales bacterium]|nr:1-acyl-sn-glycerol-3-phosphate acyltransferase [Rhodothermales bacterium]
MTDTFEIPSPKPLEKTLWTRLHFLWSAFWALVVTTVCTTGYLVAQVVRPGTETFSWWAGAWGRGMFFFAGIRLKLVDRRTETLSGACVLVANHQNGLDIPLVAAVLPMAFGFVAKAELEHAPLLGAALRHSPSVFVDKGDPRRSLASIKRAGEQIRSGSSVLIFPEGQRSYSGHLGAFMRGGFLLALESGVPLVPVTIVDAAAVFDESRWVSRPGVVHCVISDSIPLEGLNRRDIPDLMRRAHTAIAEELPEAWRNPPDQVQ